MSLLAISDIAYITLKTVSGAIPIWKSYSKASVVNIRTEHQVLFCCQWA